jgi:hypothetical protein
VRAGPISNGDDDDGFGSNGLCDLEEAQRLMDPIAWLVGAATVLATLLPSFSYWRKGNISQAFLVGLLSEALKNGLIMTSLVSVNWSCLQQFGLIVPTGNHAIFLPYSLIVFSLADNILAFIAILSRWGQDLDDTFDQFKWSGDDSNFYRRIMTFATVVIFGGLGGFMQLALILEGIVDNPEESGKNALNSWASWAFVIRASLGGLFGAILLLVGAIYPGKMRVAWKTYKILAGDIPGLVASVDLTVVLLVGWLGEAFADFVHIALYIPPWLKGRRKASPTQQEARV